MSCSTPRKEREREREDELDTSEIALYVCLLWIDIFTLKCLVALLFCRNCYIRLGLQNDLFYFSRLVNQQVEEIGISLSTR